MKRYTLLKWLKYKLGLLIFLGFGFTANAQVVTTQAEAFDSQSGGVTIGGSTDGTNRIKGFEQNRWVEYNAINFPNSGDYRISFRVSTPFSNARIKFFVDGQLTSTINMPNTGGWNSGWTTEEATINIPGGSRTIRLQTETEGVTVNWWSFESLNTNSSEVVVYAPELTRNNQSCDFNRTLSPNLNLSGITALKFDFYTNQNLNAVTGGQFELTASGGPDNQEYHANSTANAIKAAPQNVWSTVTLPFDISNTTEVGKTGSPSASSIQSINYFRLYLSNEPNGNYRIRNIRAVITAVDTEAPTAPGSLSTSNVTETSAQLSWSASSDNVGVTGYNVYVDGVFNKLVTGVSTTINGLSPGTPYNLKVKAIDAAGNISPFSIVNTVITGPDVPLRIYSITGTNQSCEFIGSFSPAKDLTGITALKFDFYTDQNLNSVTGGQFELTSSGTYDNQEYHSNATSTILKAAPQNAWTTVTIPFNVNNTSEVGRSGSPTANTIAAINYFRLYLSNEPTGVYRIRNLRAVVGDTEAPTVPVGLSATAITQTNATITWSAASDNVGVTAYDVYRNNALVQTISGTSYNASGLSAGTSYTFSVRAKDDAGNVSAQSNSLSVNTQSALQIVQAEDFNAQSGGVSVGSSTDGTNRIRGFEQNRWIDFNNINFPVAGDYTIGFRVSTPFSNARVKFIVNGQLLKTVDMPNTGGWNTGWTTQYTTINIPSGNTTVRLQAETEGMTLNWWSFQSSASSGGGGGNENPTPSDKILLPVEVLGAKGTTEDRTFILSEQAKNNASRLWLQINNLSYEDKASVKINNQGWISLNHNTSGINIQPQAMKRGGMVHGGFNTISLSIPASGLVTGNNTISFKFNTSDGISMGYRVVKINLQNSSGQNLLGTNYFVDDDPAAWAGPYTDAQSIQQGKDLWDGDTKQLWNHPLDNNETGNWYSYQLPSSRLIKANCSSCHTTDGRDLEIFSYSNKSIIERAKFHKLSEEDGKKIASYIRSLSGSISNVERVGRPWNPPFQPGAAIANETDMTKWAAGAGLDAVLDNDADMLNYLFPNGVSQSQIDQQFDSDEMYDRTAIPLAIQLPDWKHWLPIIHPLDAYTKTEGNGKSYIENGHTYNAEGSNRDIDPLEGIEILRNYLEGENIENLSGSQLRSKRSQIQGRMRDMWRNFRFFQQVGAGSDKNHSPSSASFVFLSIL